MKTFTNRRFQTRPHKSPTMVEGNDVRRRRDRNPPENTISAERQTLQDLKPLLKDRGDGLYSIDPDIDWRNDNKCMKSNSKSIKKRSDMKRVENDLEKEEDDAFESSRRYPGEMRLKGEVDGKTEDNCVSSFKKRAKDIAVFSKVKCRSDRSVFSSKMLLFGFVMAAAMLDPMLYVDARSAEPRYETAYACEGKTLKISCPEGTVIHLIRANYGRFSITICNDHGNTDWSVNCMSTRSLRVLHTRCSNNQNCSILASTNQFGDPCPNTLKYLEAHYQCVTASTTSTTNRPSPPWLITSQPTVWRSTPPAPKGAPAQAGGAPAGERRKPTVITPPTFRPHITMPPELKPGDIGTKKTTTKSPEPATPDKEAPKTSQVDATADSGGDQEDDGKAKGSDGDRSRPRNDKPSRDREDEANATEESAQWPSVRVEDKDATPANPGAKDGEDQPGVSPDIEIDGFGRRYEHTAGNLPTHPPSAGSGVMSGRSYCAPAYARGLHWNWTLAGSYAVQPCPGGATGLARWRCTLTPTSQPAEARGRRAGAGGAAGGGGGLPSGENYLDLGLEAPSERDQLVRRLAADDLLKSRDAEAPEHLTEYRGNVDMLPDAQASSVNSGHAMEYPLADAVPIWHGATPDLSECRSVWLNSLEARVREGESLLGISNDLAQVTSSKTLYGGDMMTTTSIMKKLAQRMAQTVHTFPERGQRVAFVTDMLLGVIKTGSNLLEEAQRASWADLSGEAQQRAATALLTQLEENAFLLADAVTAEKTILQIVKNICLSVRVLEVRSVEDETFPSPVAQEQWRASQDTITIPRAALLENRENELVRIVFVAFDRLEEILQPVYREGAGGTRAPHAAVHPATAAPAQLPLNSERERRNVTRVLNSKVISASLGKGRHIQLSQSVRLTLRHIRTENVSNPTCVFWDYTVNVWSSEGCQVDWSNGTHTGCSCSHLTNFAILMDLHGTQLSAGHELALRLVTLVGCAVSAVALLAAVIVFQCFRNMKSDRVTIHKNLCACLLIAEVIFMVGIDQTDNRVLCGVIAGLLHYFFLAAFAWMFLEGFHLYAMLVEVFEPEQPRARWYCAVAYAAPALIVLVSAAVFPEGYGTRRHCWLSSDHMFVMSFVGPVALVLAANWICLSMVIYMMCHHSNVSVKAKENSKLYKIRVWLNSSLVLAFLLGLTWTFGLLYLSEQTVGVAYAFSILNSLQGLFIFVFHCLQNEIFQKEMARVCRRHRWLSCCLSLTTPTPAPLPANNHAATASSSHHHTDTLRHGSVKSRRYQQSAPPESDDVLDPRDGLTSYKIQPEASRWSVRPTAPIYVPSDELGRYSPGLQPSHRTPTPQNLLPNSASHSHSIASMHSQFSYNRNNLDPTDYQNMNSGRSRSPSCFSNKMAPPGSANVDWGLVANPIVGGGSSINMWKNTSSKHHTSTLPHHDAVSRQMAQQSHLHSPYSDCDAPVAPPSPRHSNKDEESPLHQPQGYQTTRSYSHAPDFRAPHVYMSQHSPGSQEMIFRKHYKDEARRKHHHHHGQNINHTYSEIAAQQGRMYRRGSEQEFRVIQDDPVYEEIERNETLMSDVSDDNSGPDCIRQSDQVGHHGSTGSKFYGDHRPLISYSPGERHHHEQHSPMDYGKYGGGKWDSLERSYEPRHYESGRLIHGYHQPQESNMRALAAVLNGENNVVCHLEPQATGYDVYQPQTGNSRTVSQPSF